MSKLFKLNNEKIFEKVKIKEFRDEKKELRNLFRQNLENKFFPNLTFLDTEYYISNPSTKKTFLNRREGRNKKQKNFVDTIAYYDKEKTFVLFEYKNNATNDEKVIQQISDYMRILKDNKNDSQNKLIENFYSDVSYKRKIPFWKKSDYNWNLIKGICVSSDFTEGQLGLADDLGLFIMWVERYENDFYLIEKDNEAEWLKIGEGTKFPKPKTAYACFLEPDWAKRLEKWINEEVKKLVAEYSFEIEKTLSGRYDCPPSRKISFLTITFKNPWNSKIWLLVPKIYLVEPSENLIGKFSLKQKTGSNKSYYYEIIDEKGNEKWQKTLDLIKTYLQDKTQKTLTYSKKELKNGI